MPTKLLRGRGTVWTLDELPLCPAFTGCLGMGIPFASSTKGSPMNFPALVDGINRMAARISPHAKLPESIDDKSFDSLFPVFVQLLCGAASDDDEPVRHATQAEALANMPTLAMSAKMFGATRPRKRTIYRDPTAAELNEARTALGLTPRT